MDEKIEIKKNQTNIIWFLGISVVFFAAYFLLNSKTAYLNDDYTYRLVFEYWRVSADPVKVSSLHDIYISMRNHYLVWGGRIPVHTMVQLLLWLVNDKIFGIINSMMVVLLGILAYFHVNFGRKRSFFLYVFILSLLWFFMPQPELTMLNLTNSVNNMWVCIYVLIFLIPYRILLAREASFRYETVLAVLIVPIGFLAGWSNEPGGAAAGAMAVLITAYLLKKRKKPPLWTYMGIVSLAAGWVIMVFAPGYRVKADKYYGVPSVLKNAIDNFSRIEKNLFQVTFKSLWPLLLIISLSAILLFRIRKMPYKNSRMKSSVIRKKIFADFAYIPEGFYGFCALVSVAIYAIAPEFVPRYLFPAAVFLTISAGIIIARIFEETDIKEKTSHIIMTVLMCICFVSVSVDALYEYNIASYNYELTTNIEKDIKSQVQQGKKNVVIKGEYRFLSSGRYNIYKYDFVGLDVIWGGTDSGYEINRMFAANFDADTYINEADMSFVKSK